MSGDEAGRVAPALLATKLHAPRLRREVVARPRLTQRLATTALPSLTLVSAPAGFGKTTLLADWFAGGEAATRSTAWLSLDGADDDPVAFWSYLVGAVRTAVPGAGDRALRLLEEAQPLEVVATALLNDLVEDPVEVVVVLDDYHVVESLDVHASVGFLLEHLPPHVHLVLAGRADPPLPLARLRARGQLLEVRAADLRFTPDEAAAYLNDAMGLTLTAPDVAALEERTEGWIAALQLAALSMHGREDASGFIESFTGDDRFVVDFLAEEVLERQTAEVRTFLLETAVLERLTGALCDAVTGGSGGRAVLERLDRANLFLVALDDRRVWYRYHHLFADVLRARLLDEHPDRVHELHRRASAWFEANGDRPRAITHALTAGDVEEAARLVELAATTMRRNRQEVTLRRWLEALPDDVFPDRPVLAITLVGARMATGDVTGVGTLLDVVQTRLAPAPGAATAIVFDHDELPKVAAQVEMYRAAVGLLGGDREAAIEHATQVLRIADPADHLGRGAAAALLGLARWSDGDLDAAHDHYLDALAELTAAGHHSDVLGCSIALADIQIARGELEDAERTYRRGLATAAAHGVLRGTADMHAGLAEVLVERNDLRAAREHLDTCVQLGDHARLPQNAYRWRVVSARIHQAEGEQDVALALLDDAERLYDTDFSPPVRRVDALRARLQLAHGDLPAARRWAADRGLGAGDELTYVGEHDHVTLARVLVASHRADPSRHPIAPARDLLDRLLRSTEDGHRTGTAIEVLLVTALAHLAAGDPTRAGAALADAIRRAEPTGHERLFVDELPMIAPLLGAVEGRSTSARQLDALRAASAAAAADPRTIATPRGPVDELSSRELEVLQLLRGDMSGPEIARTLHVSLNTLRTHTRNIFTKLGATNRREAVRRAGELGL